MAMIRKIFRLFAHLILFAHFSHCLRRVTSSESGPIYKLKYYRVSYTVSKRVCCKGYTECTRSSSRCCQLESPKECHKQNDCAQICNASYTCSCYSGYRLASNGHDCNDINECDEGTHKCSQICKNTIGSYHCSCELYFCLASDGLSCEYDGFTIEPSSARITLGDNATFHCQFPGADTVEWKVNNTPLGEQTVIKEGDISSKTEDGDIYVLSIAALNSSYNRTTINCIAVTSNQCQQRVKSPTVNLLIQLKGNVDVTINIHHHTHASEMAGTIIGSITGVIIALGTCFGTIIACIQFIKPKNRHPEGEENQNNNQDQQQVQQQDQPLNQCQDRNSNRIVN